MAEKGYVVVFKNDSCDIYTSNDCKIIGNKVLFAKKVNGLYKCKLQGRPVPDVELSKPLQSRQRTVRANAATCVPASTWHKRLGHLNSKGMSILGGGKQCMGVLFQKEDGTRSCVSCLTGKMHMAPFPRAGRRFLVDYETLKINNELSSHEISTEEAENKSGSMSISDAEIPTPVWSPLSDDYHTGDEDESPSSSSSLPAPSRQGGATDAPDAVSSRPVRTTRGNIPTKYKDYDLTSMLADASSLVLYDMRPSKLRIHMAPLGRLGSLWFYLSLMFLSNWQDFSYRGVLDQPDPTPLGKILYG
ncbi:GAG-pre-integrase domain-containing protein [Phthorimaea operculella]|nr:GAG-pre-integrase domain-containing protein [Phthorimaea operculella]